MGRQIKRVAADFNWPLEKVWRGYINPFYEHSHQCPDCEIGYSPMAQRFYDEWYGKVEFDPVAYGSKLLTPEHPVLRAWVEAQVDRSIAAAASGTAMEYSPKKGATFNGRHCYYTDNGRLTREQAVEREIIRLLGHYNNQWCHHLVEADVKALVDGDRLYDFTRRPLKGVPMEDYVRHHAYLLWEEDKLAGNIEQPPQHYWEKSVEDHDGYWLPRWNGYMPTPDEVNGWSLCGMGHDSINAHICVKARCEREGYEIVCPTCNGTGRYWEPKEAEEWAENWEKEEPPAGEAYQVWETVSEGSPISPAFLHPEDLARWMANSPPWGAAQPMSADKWLKWITGSGYAVSAVSVGSELKDGVLAAVEMMD
jgi:hypothetical protein